MSWNKKKKFVTQSVLWSFQFGSSCPLAIENFLAISILLSSTPYSLLFFPRNLITEISCWSSNFILSLLDYNSFIFLFHFFRDCSFDLVVIAFLFVVIFIYSQELGLLWKYWDGYFLIHLSKDVNIFNLNFSSISYIVFSPESLFVWFVFITVFNVVGFIQMFGSLWLAIHIFLMVFADIYCTYHSIHPFQVHMSTFCSVITELCSHHHSKA